jgi:hypothetical protein
VQTSRDREIVCWIGRMGAAGAEDVMQRFAMGRSWAYARLNGLVTGGLLEQRTLLHRQPGLYIATHEGLRWCDLQRLGVYRVGPGGFEHAQKAAHVASELQVALPGWEVLSERDIRQQEADLQELVASARVGELPAGRPALHRPDLALKSNDHRVVAVEVELSVKAPRRLATICRGWARARHIDSVYYLATPAAARAVERAVRETRSEDRIRILPIEDVTALASEIQGSR